ncbi:hypothetical protein [Cerasicoccus fimbriatus]|uniref:hypothetical protein n=1 Tax=Cerasicoccus fimbriatus TaxID=3014554 RepID=UPI0022B51923|nr:hypothetical protein [Cerasicoccus sp. TK19100]
MLFLVRVFVNSSSVHIMLRKPNKTLIRQFFCLSLFLILACNASAVLELRLNTNTKEFAIFGSDSGTPHDIGGAGLISWSLRDLGGTTNSVVDYWNEKAFDTNVGHPGGYYSDTVLASQIWSGGDIIFQLNVTDAVYQTITGNGYYQSYSGLGAEGRAKLEGLIGQNLLLGVRLSGEGFQPVKITSSSIPEPASFCALAGSAIFICVFIRRSPKIL